MKMIRLFIVFMIVLINGCLRTIPTIKEYTDYWIGRPISEMKQLVLMPQSYGSRIGWKEKTYQLENGNWVYVEPDSKNCLIHWEVNPQGFIVGYKLEGNCV